MREAKEFNLETLRKVSKRDSRAGELYATTYGAWEFPTEADDPLKLDRLYSVSSLHNWGPVVSQQLITVSECAKPLCFVLLFLGRAQLYAGMVLWSHVRVVVVMQDTPSPSPTRPRTPTVPYDHVMEEWCSAFSLTKITFLSRVHRLVGG